MRTPSRIVLLAAGVVVLPAACLATDWPHWRGPNYNGSTDETNLPDSWSATENVAWTADMPGPGEGTPVIAEGRLYVASTAKGGVVALCLDAKTGKLLWEKSVDKGGRARRHTLASSSPVTDGKRAFFLYGSGVMAAFDAGGKELWKRNLTQETGNWRILHTYGASPLLYDGRIYVAVVHRAASSVLALSGDTGKTLWKQARPSDAKGESMESYATPVLYTGKGGPGIIVAGGGVVTMHSPGDGRELWRFDYGSGQNWRLVPTPAVTDGLIIAGRPMKAPCYAIRVGTGRPGKAWDCKPGPDVCSPAYHDGLAYILDDNTKELSCVDASSGKVLWSSKAGSATMRASPTVADGKVYTIDERGDVSVFAAGRQMKKIASFSMKEKTCWATISGADGRMYVRSASKLYCVQKGAGGG